MTGRIMGLDVGSRTVGVAISDLLGWTAQGIEIISINEDEGYYGYDRIKQLIREYDVKKIVVGLPKNMDNSIGPRAEASMTYGKHLEQRFNLPVVYQDERLSTVSAERMLIDEGNVSRQKRKQVIDKLAAVVILQNYLDYQSHQNG